jgi:AraC family transcriptional regulator, regulatory protein of adaptative response / DNA-3-methyladenine glycosylase II
MLPDHETCYRAISSKDSRFDGRLFTAVLTTGIYCRPVCPARLPQSGNVHFYPSAAAAQEAGFRPCLRCRPETAPDTPAWRGTSATIGRAMRLIEEGALDDRNVGHLAMRLGMGDRQLRRLFIKHIGATPIAVAQTRRFLLAKQLLHETRLPMAQVALASGFGSIRRFNEVFQTLFKRAPMDIRRGLADEVAHEAGGEIALRLRFRPPYDWDGVVNFLQQRQYADVEGFVGTDYCRSFFIDGTSGIVRVGQGGTDWLSVRVTCESLACLPKVITKVRNAFDLAADPAAINEDLTKDALLASVVARRPGLRVPCSWDGFEGVVRAVLGQQITVKAAIALGNRFVQNFGQALPANLSLSGVVKRRFPDPIHVAAADMGFMPMPKSRQRTISAVAHAFVDQPDLLQGDVAEVQKRLAALAGIGPWTLDYIALRVLRDPDALPATDVALVRAISQLNGRATSPAQLSAMGHDLQPWRSYAAQHLWASLGD